MGAAAVGLMAIVALAFSRFLIFLMTGSQGLFKAKTTLYTYLDDSSALAAARRAAQRNPHRESGRGRPFRLSDPSRVVRITLEIDDDFLPRFRWTRRR